MVIVFPGEVKKANETDTIGNKYAAILLGGEKKQNFKNAANSTKVIGGQKPPQALVQRISNTGVLYLKFT